MLRLNIFGIWVISIVIAVPIRVALIVGGGPVIARRVTGPTSPRPDTPRLRIVLPQGLHNLMRHTIAHAQRHDPQYEHAVKREIVVHERVQAPLHRVLRVLESHSRPYVIETWTGRQPITPDDKIVAVGYAHEPQPGPEQREQLLVVQVDGQHTLDRVVVHKRVDVGPDAKVAGTLARKISMQHGVGGRYGIQRVGEHVWARESAAATFTRVAERVLAVQRVEQDCGPQDGLLTRSAERTFDV